MSTPDDPIHSAAATGFQKEAERYQRGRPDYPAEVATWLREAIRLDPGKTAVDLGAGTGRFTRWVAATGAGVIAVEPVEAMREQLSQLGLVGVTVEAGSADAIPLPEASVDTVVCAQAFHWFSTDSAVEEIHRVLKPGGVFGLIWNVRDESVPWVAELTRLIAPYEGDAPRFASGEWRKCFPAVGFGPLQQTAFDHSHRGPAEQVIVDRTLSVSFIASLSDEEKQEVTRNLHDLIARTPELTGKAEVTFPYRTEVFWCVKES